MENEVRKVKDYKEARAYFDTHGFRFTAGSMKYLISQHKSFAEVGNLANEENCLYMLTSAISSHNLDEAFDIAYKFMEHGIGLRLLHYMLKELAKEQDFFMSQNNLEIFEEISTKADNLGNQDIANVIMTEIQMLNQDMKDLS